MNEYPTKFAFSVSHTTRPPRNGEIDGVHYHFTTKENMLRDIEKGLFIEHAYVHNNLYGTSFKAVKDILAIQRAAS
jgi:guanylate kinase